MSRQKNECIVKTTYLRSGRSLLLQTNIYVVSGYIFCLRGRLERILNHPKSSGFVPFRLPFKYESLKLKDLRLFVCRTWLCEGIHSHNFVVNTIFCYCGLGWNIRATMAYFFLKKFNLLSNFIQSACY
jgi:hypothetical protein